MASHPPPGPQNVIEKEEESRKLCKFPSVLLIFKREELEDPEWGKSHPMRDARRSLSAGGCELGDGGVFWKKSHDIRRCSSHLLSTCVLWESQAEKNQHKTGSCPLKLLGVHTRSKGRAALCGHFHSVFKIDSSGISWVLICGLLDIKFWNYSVCSGE